MELSGNFLFIVLSVEWTKKKEQLVINAKKKNCRKQPHYGVTEPLHCSSHKLEGRKIFTTEVVMKRTVR